MSESTVKGIDISEFQTVTDWNAVKAAGIRFAILRAGFGRYEEDSAFRANARGATAAGIPIGVYWFSYALDKAGAEEEARKCLEVIQGHQITLPVYFDFEYDTVSYAKKQGVTLGRQAFNDHSAAFCQTIEAAGYRAGVYYNLDYLDRLVDMDRIGKYSLWFAQYNSYPQASGWDLWQYSSTGSVPGISGRVDMDQADAGFLKGIAPREQAEGWQKTDGRWRFRRADGTWTTDRWAQIDGKWYWFDEGGYMAANRWQLSDGKAYYLGADGAMAANRSLRIDGNGALTPAGAFYRTLGEVPSGYRTTLDGLVKKRILRGEGGSGDGLVLNMGEDAVRTLVLLDRAGAFG